jgi:hypothetical protein
MVIGEKFAWAHLPKTGGTATLELFLLFPELIAFADVDESNVKHTTFGERPKEVAGKTLVMNLRRLPFWVLSRAQHVARWGVYPNYEPIPMASSRELSESDFPDSRLSLYTGRDRFEVDRWFRMEHLAEDFLDFVSEYAEVTEERRRAVFSMRMVNAHGYDHDLGSWFSRDQIARIYERNPIWAALERELYGGLLALPDPVRGRV